MTIQSGKTLPGPTCHTSPSSVTLSLPRHTYTFSLSPVHALGQAAMEAEVDRAAGDAGKGQRAATRRCPTTPAPSRSSPLRLHVLRCHPLPLAIARHALVADDARERGGVKEGKRRKRRRDPMVHVSTACRPSSGFGEAGFGARHGSSEAGRSPSTEASSPPLPSHPRAHSQPRPLFAAPAAD